MQLQQPNWLEYYDSTDSNWQLKMIAKKCLHGVFDRSYRIPSDIKLKCEIFGFDVDAFLKDVKVNSAVKKIKAIIGKDFSGLFGHNFYENIDQFNGLFEHNFYANIYRYCSKNVNDHANVHMNLEWLLSDIPLRWYIFKCSNTWKRWHTARWYRNAIELRNDLSWRFEDQTKVLCK